MSMPPQPPPGPYGPPPPQYGPYGRQPPSGPYQAPQPAYAYPPQTPPGAPHAPGPWGQPGMPPQPQRKNRGWLVVGIVVGVIALVTAIGLGVFKLADEGADMAFPEATHKLVVPRTLLDEEFVLGQDVSETEGKEIEDTYDPSIRDPKAAIGQYTSDEDGGVLVVSGMYGKLASPALARAKILKGAAEADGGKVAVPAKEFRPDGHDIVVECQVVQYTDVGGTAAMPMCAWGDDNTAAMVAVVRPGEATKDAADLDLEKAAEETLRVRAEIRQPIG
ncbi:hypothetical protein ABZ424_21685 [Streptomyces sp. NPDC005790]|uniref:hypothetical protein n=1 Tax=Streptomyces sp. NPDC005790 TaxID=3154777 RepID=UPI0033D80325